MFVASHRIAGLVFRTESNVPLPGLLAGPFQAFVTSGDAAPDVRHRIHWVAPEALAAAGPAGAQEREALLRAALWEPGAETNDLWRAPEVGDWLRRAGTAAGTQVLLGPRTLVGRDFARRVLDFFYAGRPGPAEPAQPWDGTETGSHFRIRALPGDPEALPPLDAGERERFRRGVTFQPEGLEGHPVLRAPAVRAWLHASLDRADQVLVGPYLDGLLIWNLDRQTMDFCYDPGCYEPQERRVADAYRRIFATFLPDLDAMLVHSSGVIRAGRAALFLAEDEGGKTTVLRRSPPESWLNDDQVILRREADGIVAHATPLGRLTAGPARAPLAGLFVLEKARTFDLVPLRPGELVKTLWDGHRVHTATLPRSAQARVFDLFCQACGQAPGYRLRFARDDVDWPAIDAVLRTRG